MRKTRGLQKLPHLCGFTSPFLFSLLVPEFNSHLGFLIVQPKARVVINVGLCKDFLTSHKNFGKGEKIREFEDLEKFIVVADRSHKCLSLMTSTHMSNSISLPLTHLVFDCVKYVRISANASTSFSLDTFLSRNTKVCTSPEDIVFILIFFRSLQLHSYRLCFVIDGL